MRNTWWKSLTVGATVMATVVACDDSPIDPESESAEVLEVSPITAAVEAGGTVTIDAVVRNAAGLALQTPIEATACDADVTVREDTTTTPLSSGTAFIVTGQTLGSSCVTVSAGSFEETVTLNVVPAALVLTGPETLPSGESATVAVEFFGADAAVAGGFDLEDVEFESLAESVISVDEFGQVQAKAPGTAQVVVSLLEEHGALRADTIAITVEPGTFGGSIAPTSAGQNEVITYTAAGVGFDDDTRVFFGDEEAYILTVSETSMDVLVPEGGDGEYLITGMGADQVAQVGTYTALDEVPLPPSGTVRGVFSGDDADDFFTIEVTAPTVVDVTASFTGDADVDLFMIQNMTLSTCGDDAFGCSMATADNPETASGVVLAPGTYQLYVNLFDAHGESRVEYEVVFE